MTENTEHSSAPKLSRRAFNTLAGSLAGLTAVNSVSQLLKYPQEAAYWVGSNVVDKLRQPEQLMPVESMTILLPRTDNTPIVEKDNRQESTVHVETEVKVEDRTVRVALPEMRLCGKFSGRELAASQFSCVGAAVLTSAEGLRDGKQELCIMAMSDEADIIAIGYQYGTVYRYDQQLREWEEALVSETEATYTVATATSFWSQFSADVDLFKTGVLIEWVEAGNRLFQTLEYQPFAAMRADLLMPSMSKNIKVKASKLAQSEDDVLQYKEKKIPFMVTEAGMLLDLEHLAEKSEYVISLWAQLRLLIEKRQQHPFPAGTLHDVSLFQGTTTAFDERFHFSVADELFETDSINDIVQKIMCLYTTATENIMQRDIAVAANSIGQGESRSSGLSPEDPYTNTASTAITLSLLRDNTQPTAEYFNRAFGQLSATVETLSDKDIQLACDRLSQVVTDQGLNIRQVVLHWVLNHWGMQQANVNYDDLPLGLYHSIGLQLIPSDREIPQFPVTQPFTTEGVRITKLPDFSVSLPTALKEVKKINFMSAIRKMILGS